MGASTSQPTTYKLQLTTQDAGHGATLALTAGLKELKESKLWYRVIIRCELGPPGEPRRLVKEADELVAMFTAGMKRLNPVGPAPR